MTASFRLGAVLAGLVAAGSTSVAAGQPPGSPPACRAGGLHRVGGEQRSLVVVAGRGLAARLAPGGRVVARFGVVNANRYPTLFSVRGRVVDGRCRTAWYLVQLPVRPNGRTGYVAAWRVSVTSVATRIDIDLSARRLRLFRAGRLRLVTRVGIGAPATPTPIGRFYVNQRLVPASPDGPFGPAALGISAFSPTLTHWTQGGPIAIHGTNDPSSIGRAASHGCVRVSNGAVATLFRVVLAGTPVVIHP